ncbi:MAG: hypothetical protein PHU14_13695, partial [Methylovulum sp.]|nr:hypothetical protein [Methylovulum sp.]
VQAEPQPTEPPPQPLFAKFIKGFNLGKPKAPEEEPVSGPTPPVLEVQAEPVSKPQWFNFFNKAPVPEPEPVIAVEPEPEPEPEGGLAKQVKGWYQKITAAKPD